MTTQITTHLNFRGDARAALERYREALGGTATVRTYADLGMPADAPGADGVVFGLLVADDGMRLMAYDVPGERAPGIVGAGATRREQGTTITDQALFVALVADGLDELRPRWDALAEGATIVEPLVASAWSAGFGMLTDRFGVTWSLSVA